MQTARSVRIISLLYCNCSALTENRFFLFQLASITSNISIWVESGGRERKYRTSMLDNMSWSKWNGNTCEWVSILCLYCLLVNRVACTRKHGNWHRTLIHMELMCNRSALWLGRAKTIKSIFFFSPNVILWPNCRCTTDLVPTDRKKEKIIVISLQLTVAPKRLPHWRKYGCH